MHLCCPRMTRKMRNLSGGLLKLLNLLKLRRRNLPSRAWPIGRPQPSQTAPAARSRLLNCRRRRGTGRYSVFSNSGPRPWSTSQCVEDGKRFLAKWGEQAEALGWDSRDLFGLHRPPERPHPSYSRLSRYDATGLIWLLQGRRVTALTADTAAIENPATGSITTYRRFNKPSYGPVGDSLDDFK
jgi:hypothetical protein